MVPLTVTRRFFCDGGMTIGEMISGGEGESMRLSSGSSSSLILTILGDWRPESSVLSRRTATSSLERFLEFLNCSMLGCLDGEIV